MKPITALTMLCLGAASAPSFAQVKSFKVSPESIFAIALAQDADTLAIVGENERVELWSLTRGKRLARLAQETVSLAVAFSPTGELAIGADRVVVWDNRQKSRILDKKMTTPITPTKVHQFSIDTKAFVTEMVTEVVDSGVSITFSPDGSRLVVGYDDDVIRIWNLNTGNLVRELRGHEAPVIAIAYSPDGKTISSASSDSTVRLWNARNGKLLRIMNDHQSDVGAVAYSPYGQLLASGGWDGQILIWDLKKRTAVSRFKGHTDRISSLAFSPRGKHLVTGSADRSVRIWRIKDGREIDRYTCKHAVSSVAFSSKDQTVVFATGDILTTGPFVDAKAVPGNIYQWRPKNLGQQRPKSKSSRQANTFSCE